MQNKYLELINLNKRYTQTVLNEINFSVKYGELLCCLGPSGCGKSTMLHCIAGIEELNSGSILLEKQNITNLPPEKRNFGMVFQNYALFPNLTVEQNIAYGLRGKKWNTKNRLERVHELLSLISLDKYEKKYPFELSGGEQQRVALARALAPSPKLLLLDEPLSALDAKIRIRLGEELRNLQRQVGITTIMVTHDQQEALMISDRIVLMSKGNIEQIGTPEEIYQKPSTKFVTEFIGNMNFITLPNTRNHKQIAIRYEDVIINVATEFHLQSEHTYIGRIEDIRYLGNTIRLRVILQDLKTNLYVDCMQSSDSTWSLNQIIAVTLPSTAWQIWD